MKINVTEVSENYAYSLPNRRFATVAIPIMASWGNGCCIKRQGVGNLPTYGTITDATSPISLEAYTGQLARPFSTTFTIPSTFEIPWQRFTANQEGVARFVSEFRGACDKFSTVKDYSYGYALTLLLSGYDVLACRITDGDEASNFTLVATSEDTAVAYNPMPGADGKIPPNVTALYPGTFGNRLWVRFRVYKGRYNQKTETGNPVESAWRTATVFLADDQGVKKAVESFSFSLTVEDASEAVPYWREAYSGKSTRSKFISIDSSNADVTPDSSTGFIYNGSGNGSGIAGQGATAPNYRWEQRDYGFWISECQMVINVGGSTSSLDFPHDIRSETVYARSGRQGTDYFIPDGVTVGNLIDTFVTPRFQDPSAPNDDGNVSPLWAVYYEQLSSSQRRVEAIRQAVLYYCMSAIPALTDKIYYEYEILMLPGWDDQDFGVEVASNAEGGAVSDNDYKASQLHKVMVATCVWGKCGVALLDAPRHAPFKCLKNWQDGGLAQQLAQSIPVASVRFNNEDIGLDTSQDVKTLDGEPLRASKGAMLANWVEYTFPMLGNIRVAISPSLAFLIVRHAQLVQQAQQQFWCQPTNQTHPMRFGRVDNRIGQTLLEYWQDNDVGVGVNPIVDDPDMGVVLRGNFTLFEQPEMTYNALRNLSTRFLFNAVAKAAFDAGRKIQLTYNNVTAMGRFKSAMYPLLDAMMDAQAIDGYLILINPDINGLDHVNANSVVGNIYLIVNGVIQDIDIALIALPPGTDLSQYTA